MVHFKQSLRDENNFKHELQDLILIVNRYKSKGEAAYGLI